LPWLAWSIAPSTGLALNDRRKRPGEGEPDKEDAVDFFRAYRSIRLPKRLVGFAEDCAALSWTKEQVAAFPEGDVEVRRSRDRRTMFLINAEWLRLVEPAEKHPWSTAVEIVWGQSEETRARRIMHRPSPDSVFVRETPAPSAWLRSYWLQSRGCVTPFHYDTRHGTITQIRGRKRCLLFPPFEGLKSLEPFSTFSFKGCNASKVGLRDQDDPRELAFLGPALVAPYETTLAPGETLYIPPYWWHHIECLDDSLSMLAFDTLAFQERIHPMMARVLAELLVVSAVKRLRPGSE
jgi:hypothetical protein